MSEEKRYKVVLGMSVTNQKGNKEFFDSGLVYSNMHYDQMVEVEAAFSQHVEEITQGMQGLIAQLVDMGIREVDEREPGREVKHVVRKDSSPGQMR